MSREGPGSLTGPLVVFRSSVAIANCARQRRGTHPTGSRNQSMEMSGGVAFSRGAAYVSMFSPCGCGKVPRDAVCDTALEGRRIRTVHVCVADIFERPSQVIAALEATLVGAESAVPSPRVVSCGDARRSTA